MTSATVLAIVCSFRRGSSLPVIFA